MERDEILNHISGVFLMTIIATLCYVINDHKILFIKKLRGIGAGKINGPGGKMEKGTIEENCIREVKEETGLSVENLRKHGIVNFYMGQREEPDWIIHVFSTSDFTGTMKKTEEAIPLWMDIKDIKYDDMWPGDKYWLPLLIDGKNFTAHEYYDKEGKKIIDKKIVINES